MFEEKKVACPSACASRRVSVTISRLSRRWEIPYEQDAQSESLSVDIKDSVFDNVALHSSHFDDVSFVQRTLSNVKLDGIHLGKVLFVGVDFKDVTFANCKRKLDEIYWGHMLVKNAQFRGSTLRNKHVYGQHGGLGRITSRIFLPEMHDSPMTIIRRKQEIGRVELKRTMGTRNSLGDDRWCKEKWYKHRIELDDRVPSHPEQFLERADDRVLGCLMHYLFSPGTMYIHQYKPEDPRIKETKQVKYEVYLFGPSTMYPYEYETEDPRKKTTKHVASHHPKPREGQTTYVGSRKCHADTTFVQSIGLPDDLTLSIRLLEVSRSCRIAARPWLYKRDFVFVCSTLGAREFLTSHERTYREVEGRHLRHPVSEIKLRYTMRCTLGFVATRDREWRCLMRFIRHEFWGLDKVHLILRENFWEKARWCDGARVVYSQTRLSEEPVSNDTGNMLCHIATLAGQALRTHATGNRVSGTSLSLEIDGANNESKQAFIEELQAYMHQQMIDRPLLVNGKGIWRLRDSLVASND